MSCVFSRQTATSGDVLLQLSMRVEQLRFVFLVWESLLRWLSVSVYGLLSLVLPPLLRYKVCYLTVHTCSQSMIGAIAFPASW